MANFGKLELKIQSDKISKIDVLPELKRGVVSLDATKSDYIVAVANKTQDTFTVCATRPENSTDVNDWVPLPIPAIPPNCTKDCDDCIEDGDWDSVMTTPCTADPFQMFIGKPDGQGGAVGGVTVVYPDCDFAGAVLCV